MSTASLRIGRLRPALSPVTLGGLLGAALVGVAVGKIGLPIVALVAFAAFAAVTVVAPDTTTLLCIFLLFANVPGVLIQSHGAPTMAGAAVPLLLMVPFAAMVRKRGTQVIVTPGFLALLVLLLAELASTVFSHNQDVALAKMQTFIFEAILLYFLSSNVIRTPEMLRQVLWVMLGAGTFLALITVFQDLTRTYWHFYGGFALPDPSFLIGKAPDPRASGPVGDPNYYGQILLVAICISLVFGWRARTPAQRLIALGATAMIAYAILLTFSRGTMLALFLVLVIMTFMRYFKSWQIFTLVLALVAVFASVPAFSQRLSSITSVTSATEQTGTDPNADQSAQGRSTEMLAALHVFMDYPVFGVGPANFPLYYRQYAEMVGGEIHDDVKGGKDKGAEAQRQAHNMYISQLAELGIVGFCAFMTIIGITLRSLIRLRRRCLAAGRRDWADLATILLLAVIGYLACGMFLTLAFERYFWLLLGICAAATTALRIPPGAPDARRRSQISL